MSPQFLCDSFPGLERAVWCIRMRTKMNLTFVHFFSFLFSPAILLSSPPPPHTHSRGSDGKGLSRGGCCYCWWKAFVALLEWHFNSFLSFVVRTKGAIGQKISLPPPPFSSFSLFAPILIFLRSAGKNNALFVSQDEPCLSWLVGIVMNTVAC